MWLGLIQKRVEIVHSFYLLIPFLLSRVEFEISGEAPRYDEKCKCCKLLFKFRKVATWEDMQVNPWRRWVNRPNIWHKWISFNTIKLRNVKHWEKCMPNRVAVFTTNSRHVQKENIAYPAQMERWRRSGCQTAVRNIELVDLGAKPGYLEFLTKAVPNGKAVVVHCQCFLFLLFL